MRTYILFSTLLIFTACGTGGDETPPSNPTPIPTPLPIVAPDYNLEWYAKITATSEFNSNYKAVNVADGSKGTTSAQLEGLVWIPAGTPNDDSIRLEWNSPVTITQIRLFDNPSAGQILKGYVTFEDRRDPNKGFPMLTFSKLEDKAATATIIMGPGSAVTAIEVHITDHANAAAGFSEIVVSGKRENVSIEEMNLAPYGHIPYSLLSSVFSPTYPDTDTGPYSSDGLKDESASTEWISANNGAGSYSGMEFDRPYVIKSVKVHDRHSGSSRFRKIALDIGDKTFAKPKSSDSDEFVEIVVDPPVSTTRIRLRVVEVVSGSDIGFSDVEVIGSYAP